MLDGIYVRALHHELSRWKGARVQKVQQVDPFTFQWHLRHPEKGKGFLIVKGGPRGLLYLAPTGEAPMEEETLFWQLLRRHLTDGRFLGARQEELERCLYLRFAGKDELEEEALFTLAVELFSRPARLILLTEDERIVDALPRTAPDDEKRPLSPGLSFSPPPPPSGDPAAWRSTGEAMEKILQDLPSLPLEKALPRAFPGLGPLLAKEVLQKVGLCPQALPEDLSPSQREALGRSLEDLFHRVGQGLWEPTLLLPGGAFAAFSLTPHPGERAVAFSSPSELLFFLERERVRREAREKALSTRMAWVKKELKRAKNTLQKREEELAEAQGEDRFRLYGELLLAHLQEVPKGAEEVILPDWEGTPQAIPLDPSLTPAENAETYFERYKKARRRKEEGTFWLQRAQREVEVLGEALLELENLQEEDLELEELEEVLSAWDMRYGFPQTEGKPKTKPKEGEPSGPRKLEGPDGWTFFVGKNQTQNHWLTFSFARPDDWWFHVRSQPGSHVIARPPAGWPKEAPPPPHVAKEAALLAARHSAARHSHDVPVDYTRKRYVRPQKGAPGQVFYQNEKTLFVSPGEDP
ncbi:MAG: NFACT family protein [Clostridiales bacterium]|nr:NFACT family protein [Clostridiales bacterium]